ncbi:MAG: hypothetical protein CMI31_13395 [Opitutae bacterium]|nr:hypothetical protein [Opitutae bacterium]
MTADWVKERRRRIRLVKKWLKPLPRRSTVHRYPILKWFGESAKKRSYLWSFRSREMIPAIYLGMVIALMPLVGVQMLVVTFFAIFLFRANLPLLIGLQWISNPLTMGPIYFADYQIGIALMEMIGLEPVINSILQPDYDWAHFKWSDLSGLLDTFPPMMLGGLVLGSFAGVVGVALYKYLAKKTKADYAFEKELEEARSSNQKNNNKEQLLEDEEA